MPKQPADHQPSEPTRRLSKAALHRAQEERASGADRTIMDRTLLDRSQFDKTIVSSARHRSRRGQKPGEGLHVAKKRPRRRRDWGKGLRRVCVLALLAEAGWALFFNPYLRVTKVRVEGAQTLAPERIYAEARVPNATNIFWMALRQPFVRCMDADPVVDHSTRRIRLPDTLILRVWERQPYATLAAGGQYWLLDAHGVPYRSLDAPYPDRPLLALQDNEVDGIQVTPETVILGRPLRGAWLRQTYALIALLERRHDLAATKITVDKNANLGLNRNDNLQILLGQPEALAQKVALAQAAVTADGGDLARRAAYIDVSSPEQPVWKPRTDSQTDRGDRETSGGE